ncbi:hypothetical protein OJAV_G00233300 [Oryzias javanicus]|uniref:Uncharacterized protein n=1 Tax=Oryzias javanicus TaxID=123683 RepID=A0A3S2TV98_ORYJA|nr:hypothetical protein OJAV_G00233300 [Oryzias javanicus]
MGEMRTRPHHPPVASQLPRQQWSFRPAGTAGETGPSEPEHSVSDVPHRNQLHTCPEPLRIRSRNRRVTGVPLRSWICKRCFEGSRCNAPPLASWGIKG